MELLPKSARAFLNMIRAEFVGTKVLIERYDSDDYAIFLDGPTRKTSM
jgi:hypothetical protein